MSKPDLVRMLIRLDQWRERLEAEAEMRPWSRDAPATSTNLEAVRLRETSFTQLRRDHLQDVILDFAAAAVDPTPTQLAEGMRRRLGTFHVQQLYRPSLIDLWRPDRDFFGKREEDRMPGAAERARLSRQQLVRSIVTTKRRIGELDSEIDERLVSEPGFDD